MEQILLRKSSSWDWPPTSGSLVVGRRRVERFVSLDNCVSQYHILYDGLLRHPGQPVTGLVAGSGPTPVGDIDDLEISVVIPSYNRSDILPRAIVSVLAQSYEVLEILVVDDGSTEDIASVVARFADPRIRLIRHSNNLGPAAARNSGIKAAKGRLIAFLDSDDEWLSDKLATQIEYLKGSPPIYRTAVCGFVLREKNTEGRREVCLDQNYDVAKEIVSGCHVSPGSTLLAHRDRFDTVGFFDEDLRRFEDWDWLIRLSESERLLAVPKPLAIVHVRHRIAHPAVSEALSFLDNKYRNRFLGRSSARLRQFYSTLSVERASEEYHAGRTAGALGFVLKTIAIYPFRNLSFFWELVRIGTLAVRQRLHGKRDIAKTSTFTSRLGEH